jgi:hypothetical protein
MDIPGREEFKCEREPRWETIKKTEKQVDKWRNMEKQGRHQTFVEEKDVFNDVGYVISFESGSNH